MTTTENKNIYAELETPGRILLVPFGVEYRPEEFDPHGVAADRNICIACAREIKVAAHLMSGYCAPRCRTIFIQALELFREANEGKHCERCESPYDALDRCHQCGLADDTN